MLNKILLKYIPIEENTIDKRLIDRVSIEAKMAPPHGMLEDLHIHKL